MARYSRGLFETSIFDIIVAVRYLSGKIINLNCFSKIGEPINI